MTPTDPPASSLPEEGPQKDRLGPPAAGFPDCVLCRDGIEHEFSECYSAEQAAAAVDEHLLRKRQEVERANAKCEHVINLPGPKTVAPGICPWCIGRWRAYWERRAGVAEGRLHELERHHHETSVAAARDLAEALRQRNAPEQPTAGPPAVPALPSGARSLLRAMDGVYAIKHDGELFVRLSEVQEEIRRAADAASPSLSAEERLRNAERGCTHSPMNMNVTSVDCCGDCAVAAIRAAESAAYARGLEDAARIAENPTFSNRGLTNGRGTAQRIRALASGNVPPGPPENPRAAAQAVEQRVSPDPVLVAALFAHRACTGLEASADVTGENGKIHGYCVVCGVPWPCGVARTGIDAALRLASAQPRAAAPDSPSGPDLVGLLRRIRQWDHLDGAGDGPYWKREIDTALAALDRAGKQEGPK